MYLVYLGLKQWRANPNNFEGERETGKGTAGSLLRRSFVVTALNPKNIAFFVTFLQQFVDPARPQK